MPNIQYTPFLYMWFLKYALSLQVINGRGEGEKGTRGNYKNLAETWKYKKTILKFKQYKKENIILLT